MLLNETKRELQWALLIDRGTFSFRVKHKTAQLVSLCISVLADQKRLDFYD